MTGLKGIEIFDPTVSGAYNYYGTFIVGTTSGSGTSADGTYEGDEAYSNDTSTNDGDAGYSKYGQTAFVAFDAPAIEAQVQQDAFPDISSASNSLTRLSVGIIMKAIILEPMKPI